MLAVRRATRRSAEPEQHIPGVLSAIRKQSRRFIVLAKRGFSETSLLASELAEKPTNEMVRRLIILRERVDRGGSF